MNHLVLIGEIGVLQGLYHRVVIPEEVFGELMDVGAPRARLRTDRMFYHALVRRAGVSVRRLGSSSGSTHHALGAVQRAVGFCWARAEGHTSGLAGPW